MPALEELHRRFLTGQVSVDEVEEWRNLLKHPGNKERTLAIFREVYRMDPFADISEDKAHSMLQQILMTKQTPHRIHLIKTAWFRYAAAIIVMLGVSSYLWFNNTTSDPINNINPTHPNSNIHPGRNKAILTLSDGSIIELENKDNGKTLQQLAIAGAGVLNKNSGTSKIGPLTQPTRANVENAFNTITTPKGGQYQIVLPDGSKVWLNAASSIKFPTAFTGNTRNVEITGEAYFEVVSNKSKIFHVKTYREEITVLGTSFNINSYNDEPTIKTSLLEGAIQVNGHLLKPGQAYKNGEVLPANLEQDLAWKQGLFNFEGANLPTVMRQLERWYDIEVKYEGKPPYFEFQGGMDRGVNLSEVLELLSKMGVHFKMQGRILTIKQ